MGVKGNSGWGKKYKAVKDREENFERERRENWIRETKRQREENKTSIGQRDTNGQTHIPTLLGKINYTD